MGKYKGRWFCAVRVSGGEGVYLRQALGWAHSNTLIDWRNIFRSLSTVLYAPGQSLLVTLDGRAQRQWFCAVRVARGALSLRQALGWANSNTLIDRRHTSPLSAALYRPAQALCETLDAAILGKWYFSVRVDGVLSLRQAMGWTHSHTSIDRRRAFPLSAALYFPRPSLYVTLDVEILGGRY